MIQVSNRQAVQIAGQAFVLAHDVPSGFNERSKLLGRRRGGVGLRGAFRHRAFCFWFKICSKGFSEDYSGMFADFFNAKPACFNTINIVFSLLEYFMYRHSET